MILSIIAESPTPAMLSAGERAFADYWTAERLSAHEAGTLTAAQSFSEQLSGAYLAMRRLDPNDARTSQIH